MNGTFYPIDNGRSRVSDEERMNTERAQIIGASMGTSKLLSGVSAPYGLKVQVKYDGGGQSTGLYTNPDDIKRFMRDFHVSEPKGLIGKPVNAQCVNLRLNALAAVPESKKKKR
jgi:hypothetical protein